MRIFISHDETRSIHEPLPKSPQEVLIRPDGQFAYVSCDASKQVMTINLKDWKVEKLINVGADDCLATVDRK